MPRRSRRWSGVGALGAAAVVLLLSGCDNFFTKGSGSSSGGTGGTTVGGAGGNYAYVLNGVTQTVSGFLIGAGTLTATPNSPYSFGFVPQAEVVTRANNFLYVAGPGALYSFAINSDGSLAGTTQATGVAIANELALAVSPDGQWLFGLNSISSTLDVWQINATTGVLTAEPGATYTITDAVASPSMLRVSPAGDYIFAAVGGAGDLVFTLDTTTGAVEPEPAPVPGVGADERQLAGDGQHRIDALYRAERCERGSGRVHDRCQRAVDSGDGLALCDGSGHV